MKDKTFAVPFKKTVYLLAYSGLCIALIRYGKKTEMESFSSFWCPWEKRKVVRIYFKNVQQRIIFANYWPDEPAHAKGFKKLL